MSPSADRGPVASDRLLRTLERLLAIDPSELEPALADAAQIVAEALAPIRSTCSCMTHLHRV